MKPRHSLFCAILLAGTASKALAAPATPDEAQRLTEVFQAYLGDEPGVVTVMPNGESYELKLDPAPLLAKIKDAKFKAKISPLVMNLSSLGGGKWKVDQDQAIEFTAMAEGAVDLAMNIASLKGTGTFDEALGLFEQSSTDATGITFKEAVTVEGEGTTNVAYTLDSMHYEQTMQSDGDGGANGTVKSVANGLKETFNIAANPQTGTPPMDFVLTAASSTSDGSITGLRAKPVMDLIAFAISHADKADVAKDQAELKEKIKDALPLWLTIEGTGSASDMKLQTMVGEFAIPKMEAEVELTGVVREAKLREKVTLEDVATPPGLIPPWASDLVPHKLTIDFNVSGLDLASPAALLLDKADFSKDPPVPPEIEAELVKLVLPNGTINVGLGPSAIVNKLAQLTFEGGMSVNPNAPPGEMPSFTSMIGLTGFDALLAALQKVPPEMGVQQAVPGLMMARGMAKTEDDGSLSWKIESGPGGAVLVNGNDLTKMGGGQ
jgi:hypothetical protein